MVEVSPGDSETVIEEWDRRGIPVTLKVLESPYREITKPIVDYVRDIRRRAPGTW